MVLQHETTTTRLDLDSLRQAKGFSLVATCKLDVEWRRIQQQDPWIAEFGRLCAETIATHKSFAVLTVELRDRILLETVAAEGLLQMAL